MCVFLVMIKIMVCSVTIIETVPSNLPSDFPDIFHLSVYIDKPAFGFSYEAFFSNVIAISFHIILLS